MAELVFVRILLWFIPGILLFYGSADLLIKPALLVVCGVLLFSLFVINIFYVRLRAYRFKWFSACLFYLLVFLFGGLSAVLHDESLSKTYFANRPATYLKVFVADEPQLKSGILRFKAVVTSSDSVALTGRLMIAVKLEQPISLNYGDELVIPAKFTLIEPPYNPSEFNYKAWLATQNIYHQAFLKQQELMMLKGNSGSRIIAFALRLRASQVEFYREIIKNDAAFAVAATLILGYRSDLSAETLSIYSKTGTIHALSVSGMHVGLIYLVLNWVLQFMNHSRLLKVFKVVLIISLIWFYALITGLSPSVLRSAIMLSVFIIAKAFSRKTNAYNIIAFAAFCLLVYDPFLIWDVGFQLSFLAVLGLIYLQPMIKNWWFIKNEWLSQLWGIAAMSLAAQFITYPLSIYYFHQFPVYFLISNLFIMIPIAVLMYLGIVILLGRFEFLGPVFEWLINFTNSGLDWIAHLPFASLGGIWLDKLELILLCLTLGLLVLALAHFNKWLLFFALTGFLTLQLLMVYDDVKAQRQKKVIVFSLRKNYAAAFIYGKSVVVFTDLYMEDRVFRYFVQPALDQHKVEEIRIINEDTGLRRHSH